MNKEFKALSDLVFDLLGAYSYDWDTHPEARATAKLLLKQFTDMVVELDTKWSSKNGVTP